MKQTFDMTQNKYRKNWLIQAIQLIHVFCVMYHDSDQLVYEIMKSVTCCFFFFIFHRFMHCSQNKYEEKSINCHLKLGENSNIYNWNRHITNNINWDSTIPRFSLYFFLFYVAWHLIDFLHRRYGDRKKAYKWDFKKKTLIQTNDRIYAMLLALPVDCMCFFFLHVSVSIYTYVCEFVCVCVHLTILCRKWKNKSKVFFKIHRMS